MKTKKPRKPRMLTSETHKYLYAGFFSKGDTGAEKFVVYLGADNYYNGPHQIHLSAAEVRRLSKWLERAAKYLEAKR